MIEMRVRDGRTVLGGLRQEGCLKARFPRCEGRPEVVSVNASGGVAGGDALSVEIALTEGARATFTAQAAERLYRVLPGDLASRVRTTINVGPRAAAEWLPQETILFDRSALDRRLVVSLGAGAWFLGTEMLVFGRAAMGESVVAGHVADTIRIAREGTLLLHDAIRMTGPIADLLARPAIANGGRAIATLVHVAEDAERKIDAVRAALAPFEAGASAWNGMLLARIVAPDGACLRAAVVAGLSALREGRALPRVWMC